MGAVFKTFFPPLPNALQSYKFTVIALRDLAKYVDPAVNPKDPFRVIEDRKKLIEAKRDGNSARPAKNNAELKFWLENAPRRSIYTPLEAR